MAEPAAVLKRKVSANDTEKCPPLNGILPLYECGNLQLLPAMTCGAQHGLCPCQDHKLWQCYSNRHFLEVLQSASSQVPADRGPQKGFTQYVKRVWFEGTCNNQHITHTMHGGLAGTTELVSYHGEGSRANEYMSDLEAFKPSK